MADAAALAFSECQSPRSRSASSRAAVGHYLPLGTIAWGLGLFYLFSKLEFLGVTTASPASRAVDRGADDNPRQIASRSDRG